MPVEYAQLCSTQDQRPSVASPVIVTLNQNDAISGVEHTADAPGDIRIVESGIYVLIAAPQVGRTSGTKDRFVDFWLRKNGQDIANSNVRYVIAGNGNKDVIVNQSMMPFERGDVINVVMKVESTDDGLGIEAIHPEGEPMIPSIIFSMHKIKDASKGRYVSTGKGTGKIWVEGN